MVQCGCFEGGSSQSDPSTVQFTVGLFSLVRRRTLVTLTTVNHATFNTHEEEEEEEEEE